jgi:hypothetical protein
VPAPEVLRGQRVVAEPRVLDAVVAAQPADTTTLRFAPDELLLLDGAGIHLDDPHAIVEDEAGFVAITIDREVVAGHVEWRLPEPGVVAQGSIAGVPARLAWLPDGRAWIVTHAAYAAELVDRLGVDP